MIIWNPTIRKSPRLFLGYYRLGIGHNGYDSYWGVVGMRFEYSYTNQIIVVFWFFGDNRKLPIMDHSIRPAQLADAPQLNHLVNSAYRGDASRQGWTTEADLLDGTRIDEAAICDLIARPDTTVLTYWEEDALLGCVELRASENKLYLGMLSVKPDTQGKGIGKKLLAASEVYARSRNVPIIFMTVISVRDELIAWYVRHGYRLTGERKPFIMPDERWGIPKKQLEFVVLAKTME